MKFNRLLIAAGLMLTIVSWAAAQDAAKTPTYIGSGKCKMCHKGEKNGNIWETWLDSKHAKAMDVLREKGEDKNAECLGCHTVGHGTASGYGADTTMWAAEDFGAVGCEACHGAGSEYKSKKVMEDKDAAIAAGLVMPTEATCTKCHNDKSPNFKGFNFEEAWAKIKHKVPPKAEGETKSE